MWPFSRKGRPSGDAVAADVEASRALIDAKALTNRADYVAERLAKARERNNFAAAVYRTFGGA